MKVVIAGVGGVGFELVKNLVQQKNNELILIDTNEERCEYLAGEVDALVLHGDGTNPEILKKAQIAEADALVATTGSDPLNTVIAMLGKRFEVEKIIVRLKETGLRSACQEIGISKIIAPRIAAAAEILSTLYGSEKVDFSVVSRHGVRLIEFEAGKFTGETLSEIELPDGAHIVAVMQDDDLKIPRQAMKLREGDELLILVENGDIRKKVKNILTADR